MSIDDEFSVVETMNINHVSASDNWPQTFRAPRGLRHLMLIGFAVPIQSPLLMTAAGRVTLSLQVIHPSTYFLPNDLLQWLSLMPRLEVLGHLLSLPSSRS